MNILPLLELFLLACFVLFCNLSLQFVKSDQKSEGVLFDYHPIVTNQENYLLRTITHDNYPYC